MRIPTDLPPRPHSRRRTVALLVTVIALVVLLVLAQGVGGFYANFLWFHWSGVGEVWTAVTVSKLALALSFIAIAFAVVWGCLFLVDLVVSRTLFLAPDTEFVRRFQQVTAPHAFWLRTGVAALLGLALGSSASSQWQNWLLFTHAVPFNMKDPLFHRDISFFVFRLPFLSFLVDWLFGLLVVAAIATAVAYFLNGAIRVQRTLTIEPRAIAHLSLLLSLLALERAWAYFYVDRFGLDVSANGYVQGAGYTDVHVRLPAMVLLAVVCLVAFVMLAFNVYQRTWVLPVVSVGLWAFLAIVVGVIYPKLYQALHVTPAQSTLETPYISRNISATTAAFDIGGVTREAFPANQDLTPGVLSRYAQTLDATQIWDPVYSYATFAKLQKQLSFYQLTNLTIDRYYVNGQLTPVVVGVRALNTGGVPSPTWVNTHLQFTHGYAGVVAPANTTSPNSNGSPNFLVGSVPVTAKIPDLAINQPSVYFAPGDDQYVIADTKQQEVDYQLADGKSKEGHYGGEGGIPIGGLGARLAFAVKLHDFNMLISSEITGKSHLIYIPDVLTEVQKALPFLKVDANPYAVIDNGEIEWVLDAYTTSPYYPYSETARTDELPGGSALQGSYNYVRDAVKVVVNAYTGKMSFYTINASGDPVMQSYEAAFPGMFHPLSSLTKTDPVLLQHLRYPQDLLAVQSAMYGRYHITNPSAFYGLGNAWDLSQTSTAAGGGASLTLPIGANGNVLRYQPIYELLQLPGQSSLSFDAIEPLVPYSQGDQLQNLAALMVVNSAYNGYGKLESLVTPTGSSSSTGNSGSSGGGIDGPGLANADIHSDPDVSQKITLLDQSGSQVILGAVQVLPLADSLLYIRPLYVSSTQTLYPKLQDVVVVYGKQVSLAPTLAGALAGVFGSAPPGITAGNSSGSGSTAVTAIPSDVRNDIASGLQAYQQAQSALTSGDLGTYQSDVTKAGQFLQQANSLLAQSNAATKSSTPSTKKASGASGATLGASGGASHAAHA
ncbi:MAG TPA: UPF0182 family protein [Acidimicrobiales bacterium]|nr:UPF0182 family protein [Acidimicrobiales bacterium]